MVQVIEYAVRQNKEGKSFISLHLEGDPEMVQSLNTGRFYLTSKRCWITSTFNEDSAKRLIGHRMPGSIIRSQCEAYQYTVKETGEVITLAHSYEYSPLELQAQPIMQQAPVMTLVG